MNATLCAGHGYWDTTHYPYGGCFRRAEADTPVTIIEGTGKFPDERKIQFEDGRVGYARGSALVTQSEVQKLLADLGL